MRLLVVKLSAFGDIVHALPAVDDAIAQGAEVHWAIDARFAFLRPILPPAVKVHLVPTKEGLAAAWRALRRLRSERFDLAVDLQGLVKSAIVARAAARRVFGFDARLIREKPATWLEHSVSFHPEERHVVQRYRAIMAEALGLERPCAYRAPRIVHAPDAPPPIEPPYTVLALTGGWATKRWPVAHWQRLAEMLAEQGERLIAVWGSDEERNTARALHHWAFVPKQRLAIDGLCGILRRARAVIGMDTGVVHLAAALGTPTITLWGPSASWNAAPFGEPHRHIESNPPCGPCFQRSCRNFRCLPSISPHQVFAAWQAYA